MSDRVEQVAKDATNKFGAYCNSQKYCISDDYDCVKCREDFESGYRSAISATREVWTTEPPTVPGWYWWTSKNAGRIVRYVFVGQGGFLVTRINVKDRGPVNDPIRNIRGQWSSEPITPPPAPVGDDPTQGK